MIWTALAAAGGFLKRLPWQLYAALAIVLVAWAWGNHRYSQGYDASEAKHAAIAAQAVAQARKADSAAQTAVDAENTLTAAENAKAREAAAANPDDPLKAAMDALSK